MEISNTPCSLDSMNKQSANQTLNDVLRNSACLESALSRMCNTRSFTHPTNGKQQKLYSFDLDKCLGHFADKYERIKRHLAQRYVQENRGFIIEMRKG